MNNIPLKLRAEMANDPYYKKCVREQDGDCNGRITYEHSMIYASRQIQERWAIVPLCWHHHLGNGLKKEINQLIALRRATQSDLARYPRKDWATLRKYLENKYPNL